MRGGGTVGLLWCPLSKAEEQLRSIRVIVKENVGGCRWLGMAGELRNWCGDRDTTRLRA